MGAIHLRRRKAWKVFLHETRLSTVLGDRRFAADVVAHLELAGASPTAPGTAAHRRSAPDVVIAHDVFALDAGAEVAERFDIPLIWDATEVPLLQHRTGDYFSRTPPGVRHLLNNGYRRRSRSITTTLAVSASLSDWLRDEYGLDRILPVFNAHGGGVEPATDDELVSHGIRPSGDLLVAPNSILRGWGFETAIGALCHLPNSFSLLAVGRIGGPHDGYRAEVDQLISARGLTERVQIMDRLPHKLFLGVLARAAVGLLLLPRANRLNLHLSLPNRFFDMAAAGTPIVSAAVGESPRWIEQYRLGAVDSFEREELLSEVILRTSRGPKPVAAVELTWAHYESQLLGELQRFGARSVVVVARKRLDQHTRVARFARSMTGAGLDVSVIGISVPEPGMSEHVEGVEYVALA